LDRIPEEERVERGVADVFHDLALPDAEELLAKSKLARAIAVAAKSRKLTQTQLAKLTGIPQPKISQLLGGSIRGFSSDRLISILNKLDQDVVIFIRPKPANENRDAYLDVTVGT